MPLKTYEITSNEFVIKNGVAQLNSEKVYDNRVLLYIPGKDPIDILYNWHIGNPEGKPYIAAKLRRKEISITFKDILLLVKNKCAELGITITDLDIIDLSCNVTMDNDNVKAPYDPHKRVEYINTLREMVFGDDEILSSSSSSSDNEEDKGFFSMLTSHWNPKTKPKSKQTKKRAKKQQNYNRSRRSYAYPNIQKL